MNAVDTNVLVRYLTNDDPRQSPLANALVETAARHAEPLWVGLGVLLELIWVLDSQYDVPREVIVKTIGRLLQNQAFRLEPPGLIAEFCRLAPQCKTEPDDLLLGLAAKQNRCEAVYTFDKLAAKNALYTLVSRVT